MSAPRIVGALALLAVATASGTVTSAKASSRGLAKRLRKATGALAVVPALELSSEQTLAVAPGALTTFSAACREAGAAAICLPMGGEGDMSSCIDAVGLVAAEQREASSSFPGPCPVLVRGWPLGRGTLERLARSGGAALVLPAGAASDAREREAAAQAADDAGLALVLETDGHSDLSADAAADALTVARVECAALQEGEEVARAAQLHEAGVRAVMLAYPAALLDEDGEEGSAYVRAVLRAFRTKRSGKFVASAFGGLPADGSTPEKRNPQLWRRAQKEAKEIMHDSKKKYGHLDLPKQ